MRGNKAGVTERVYFQQEPTVQGTAGFCSIGWRAWSIINLSFFTQLFIKLQFFCSRVWLKDQRVCNSVMVKDLFCYELYLKQYSQDLCLQKIWKANRILAFLNCHRGQKDKISFGTGDGIYAVTVHKGRCKWALWAFRESEAIAVTLRNMNLYPTCFQVTPWFEKKNTWKYYQFLMSAVVQKAGCVNWECGTFEAFREGVNCFWCSLLLSRGKSYHIFDF